MKHLQAKSSHEDFLNCIKKILYVTQWPPLKAGAIALQLNISVMPRKKLFSTSPKHHTLRGYTGEVYKTRKCHQFPLRVPKIDLEVSTSSKKRL